MYEHFDHTADLGLRMKAATFEELLADAGRGLLAMIVANPEAVRPVQSRTITLAASQPQYLLFDWLSELLFAFESEKLRLSDFEIQLQGDDGLVATCRGEPMDQPRHIMDHEVKATTYHGLRVEQQDGAWFAEVIVDI